MQNQRMAEKLSGDASEQCLDVRVIGKEVEPGVFELEAFLPEVDYCDAQTESWIWSIGRRKSDGKIFAAVDTRYYLDDAYECLWLR